MFLMLSNRFFFSILKSILFKARKTLLFRYQTISYSVLITQGRRKKPYDLIQFFVLSLIHNNIIIHYFMRVSGPQEITNSFSEGKHLLNLI